MLHGLRRHGYRAGLRRRKVVTAETGSIEAGAIPGWDARNGVKFKLISAAAEVLGVSVRTPWCEYPEEVKQVFLYGNEQTRKLRVPFIGVMNDLQRQWDDPRTLSYMRQGLETYRSDVTCPVCKGERLRPELLSVYVGDGDKRYSYGEMNSMSLSQLRAAFAGLEFSERRAAVAERLTAAISSRLAFLENVGLGYLSLNRRADTLSGGEMQRIRLASQIGSGLSGVLYVLDEPSIGLHQRDNERLLKSLADLRTSATPSSSSSMTRTPCVRPTISSTWGPVRARRAARFSLPARPRRSWQASAP